jgi:hypothetical protein
LLSEEGLKVLLFSEWERMLELVRDLAEDMGVGFAWHTGSVPQGRRRQEIQRFKKDPDCRLFLSTDSGGVGLNLQAAGAVINLDLPWNPARLEQRIARAWRKHQTRSVQVIHLVTEESIEHRMLSILAGKKTVAESVLDGRGDLDELPLPSGRAVFLQRLEEILGQTLATETAKGAAPAASETPPFERLHQDLAALCGERLLMLALLEESRTALVVLDRSDRPDRSDRLDGAADPLQGEIEAAVHRNFREEFRRPALEVLDRNTYETLLRLADAGVLQLSAESGDKEGARLYRSPALVDSGAEHRRQRLAAARQRFAEGERNLRMALLLHGNGFEAEALPPLTQALEQGLLSLARLAGIEGEEVAVISARVQDRFGEPGREAVTLWAALAANRKEMGATVEKTWFERGETLLRQVEEILERTALGGSPAREP